MNSGRSKVMGGSSDGNIIVKSGKRPCGIVVCLPRPMEGKGRSTVQFFGELPVPLHAAGVVERLNCCDFLYNYGILSTMIIFWDLIDAILFLKGLLFVGMCVFARALCMYAMCLPLLMGLLMTERSQSCFDQMIVLAPSH